MGGDEAISGASNLERTLRFLGVEVREADSGRLLSAAEIAIDSGMVCAVIPKPNTAMLAIAGLPLLFRRKKSR